MLNNKPFAIRAGVANSGGWAKKNGSAAMGLGGGWVDSGGGWLDFFWVGQELCF